MADRPPRTAGVRVESDPAAAVLRLTVRGRWDRRLRGAAGTGLRDCLAGDPAALLVDLSPLDDRAGDSARTWLAAAARIAPAPVAVSVPPGAALAARLRRLAGPRRPELYDAPGPAWQALVAAAPVVDRLRLRLAPEPLAAAYARDLVGAACGAWRLPHLLHPGRLVVSELVGNAVEHARTPVTVTVSRRGGGLHLAVADGDPRPPRRRDPAPPVPGRPLDEHGRGLGVVAAVAAAWGVLAVPPGKVVWAGVR